MLDTFIYVGFIETELARSYGQRQGVVKASEWLVATIRALCSLVYLPSNRLRALAKRVSLQ